MSSPSRLGNLAWLSAMLLTLPPSPPVKTPRRAGDTVDLTTPRKLNEPVLLEATTDVKVAGTLDLAPVRGQKVKRLDGTQKLERRLVDEFTQVEGDWAAKRYVAAWRSTENGDPSDPEIEGAELQLSLAEGRGKAELVGERKISPATAQMLANQARSAALALDLPAAMAIGDKVDHGFESLVPLLLDLDGTLESATAELVLTGVDAKTQVATLSGHCTAKEKITDPVDGTGEYAFDLTVEIDLAGHRVAAAAAKGSGKLSGHKLLAEMNATLDFTAKVKATTGEAATKARAEKPKFRDVERAIGDSGVTCKLPSHFFESPVEGTGPVQYVTHLSDAQALLVTFLSIPIKVPVANGMSATEGQITRANPGWKPKDVKSGLGRGRGAAVEKEGEIVDVEVYPVGEDHLLKLTVSGKPDARKAYAQEITKLRASLRAKSN